MAIPQARLTDVGTGVCSIHGPKTGKIITCSNNTKLNGLGVARVGDVVLATCGHTGVLVSGSPNVKTNGKQNIRIGDPFTGIFSGNIITGSGNKSTN